MTLTASTKINDNLERQIYLAILVASLGYFVDIYDLILFSIVRIPSLRELNIGSAEMMKSGMMLLNLQMGGMLLGGFLFGVMGDRVGRLSVLFGSILIYSLANLLNGFVTTLDQYAILRFIAGIGLAGELGAGVTLITEIMPQNRRGWGTTIIAGVGGMGALFAWFIADHWNWRTAYIIGGIMGLVLLFLRLGVAESGLFAKTKLDKHIKRGDFLGLFLNKNSFVKFMACVAIGVPIWYVIGILVTLSPEFSSSIGVVGEVAAGRAIFFCYSGLIAGDLISGLISQKLQSRKKAVLVFLVATILGVVLYFGVRGLSLFGFYALCFYLGMSTGYWAMFVTIAAEQFGTNLRATVTTLSPNFVRGSLVPISALFSCLKDSWGMVNSGVAVGILTLAIAFWGLRRIRESYHLDLNFYEHHK